MFVLFCSVLLFPVRYFILYVLLSLCFFIIVIYFFKRGSEPLSMDYMASIYLTRCYIKYMCCTIKEMDE